MSSKAGNFRGDWNGLGLKKSFYNFFNEIFKTNFFTKKDFT